MKVFVAGATGAIGKPLVAALVAAKHDVVGMTSTDAGRRALVERGAEPFVVDAFDTHAVSAAMLRIRPGAVIEELTSLPKRYTPEEMRAAAPRDRRLRLEAGANVHNGARAAGAEIYVVQSTGFFTPTAQASQRKKIRLRTKLLRRWPRAWIHTRKSRHEYWAARMCPA